MDTQCLAAIGHGFSTAFGWKLGQERRNLIEFDKKFKSIDFCCVCVCVCVCVDVTEDT